MQQWEIVYSWDSVHVEISLCIDKMVVLYRTWPDRWLCRHNPGKGMREGHMALCSHLSGPVNWQVCMKTRRDTKGNQRWLTLKNAPASQKQLWGDFHQEKLPVFNSMVLIAHFHSSWHFLLAKQNKQTKNKYTLYKIKLSLKKNYFSQARGLTVPTLIMRSQISNESWLLMAHFFQCGSMSINWRIF